MDHPFVCGTSSSPCGPDTQAPALLPGMFPLGTTNVLGSNQFLNQLAQQFSRGVENSDSNPDDDDDDRWVQAVLGSCCHRLPLSTILPPLQG